MAFTSFPRATASAYLRRSTPGAPAIVPSPIASCRAARSGVRRNHYGWGARKPNFFSRQTNSPGSKGFTASLRIRLVHPSPRTSSSGIENAKETHDSREMERGAGRPRPSSRGHSRAAPCAAARMLGHRLLTVSDGERLQWPRTRAAITPTVIGERSSSRWSMIDRVCVRPERKCRRFRRCPHRRRNPKSAQPTESGPSAILFARAGSHQNLHLSRL